ncbi:MAG TPA: protocatechuate 3,4-dioxygenase subunit alpha [Pseudonocardiaceae bacterium]|jgi:protocatechuate 3,4-dioxygenase alpha subunit|nr:protocatechuate 3,4-dioxygenase subunit alpha [Pseudonocardiaceae bacterium]
MTDVTPSQTVGPFLHIGLPWADGQFAVREGTPGSFTITGRVLDGEGAPLPDALVETWQTGGDGRQGFARCATDQNGTYRVVTVRPPAEPDRDGATEAPHVDVAVFSRGLLNHLVTRIYFPDALENAADPVLRSIDTDRRDTLVAEEVAGGYRFDIHLQGDGETVFFDV